MTGQLYPKIIRNNSLKYYLKHFALTPRLINNLDIYNKIVQQFDRSINSNN